MSQETWSDWEDPLERFSAATQMVVSLIDDDGVRRLGPYVPNRIGRVLDGEAQWEAPGGCAAVDDALARRCFETGEIQVDHFCAALRVQAAPIVLGGRQRACVVYGWVFDRFASSMSARSIAARLGIVEGQLWSAARRESPISAARFETFTALLETLISSTSQQLDAKAGLEELARVRAQFLARVAHDLRTPLQALGLRIDVLQTSDLSDVERTREALEKMTLNVRQQASLVEDLLDAARTLTGKLTVRRVPIALDEVLREAIVVIQPQAEEAGIRVTMAPSNETVDGDRGRLRQVFANLLQNAVKFAPGGRIDVSATVDEQHVMVAIHDTGRGIDPSFVPKIFEAFAKQEEENEQGLGLGLAIAKEIVALHDGDIRVSSPGLGSGTTFTVALPRRSS